MGDSLRDLDLKAGKDSLGDLVLREDKVFLRDLVDKDKASPRVRVALVSVKAVNRDSPSKVVNKGKDFKANRSCIQNNLEVLQLWVTRDNYVIFTIEIKFI